MILFERHEFDERTIYGKRDFIPNLWRTKNLELAFKAEVILEREKRKGGEKVVIS